MKLKQTANFNISTDQSKAIPVHSQPQVTPQRIRQTPTNQSNIFTPEKQIDMSRSGKKVFETKETLFNRTQQADKVPSMHPLKTQDQPTVSFYPTVKNKDHQDYRPRETAQRSPLQSAKHLYHDKDDNLISMTTKERRIKDDMSNIFHQDRKQSHQTINPSIDRLFPHSLCQWNDIKLCTSIANVNERAIFDSSYSKMKKQEEGQSRYFSPSTMRENVSRKSQAKIEINEPNEQIKKKNQNFSDLFDLQYGDKELTKRVRSLSPSLKWTDHDSIRNRNDLIMQTENLQSPGATKFGNSRLSENHLNCSNTMKQMRGEPKGIEQMNIPIVEYKQVRRDQNTYRTPQNLTFTGIYSWKNNYKKK